MRRQKKRVQYQFHRGLPHRQFWVAFIVIFISSAVVILTISDGGMPLTGNAARNTIAFQKAGSETYWEIKVGGIQTGRATLFEDVSRELIAAEENQAIPFDGRAYSKVSIRARYPERYGPVKYELKIPKRDLIDNYIFPTEVEFYADGEQKNVTFLREEGGYLYYIVEAGFGDIVIGKRTAVREEEPMAEEAADAGEIPGEEVLEEETAEEREPIHGKAITRPVPPHDEGRGFLAWLKKVFGVG